MMGSRCRSDVSRAELPKHGIDGLESRIDRDLPNRDLALKLVEEALLIAGSGLEKLDLKIVNATLAELNHAFALFSPYRDTRKVTIFGSARTLSDEPSYLMAKEVAGKFADQGWMVVTGGGPGIMAAGMSGAGSRNAFGINIRLPFEAPFVEPDGETKLIEMKYFFTRKLMLMKESDAFISFPGGLGTLDETFELLTLMQTGKAQLAPLVLVDPAGFGYWDALDHFLKSQTLARGLVSEEDLGLYRILHSIEETVDEVTGFYSNYDSLRWIGSRLILRLKEPLDESKLDELNSEFSDIITSGRIRTVPPSPQEIADQDRVELPRISLLFNRRSYGRLRLLIDRISAS